MIAEISNPSDPYTIEVGNDKLPTCIAVLLLGEGAYGLKDESNEFLLPIFLFGGSDAWLAKNGITSLDDYIDANAGAIATALESVVIGSRTTRVAFERVLAAVTNDEDRKAARAEWLDENRSSMNDIGGHAMTLAERLRKIESDRSAK